jgi:hypothetical protein
LDDKIVFRCECGASLGAPKSAAGRQGKCKHCGQVLRVPGKSDAPSSDFVEIIEEFCSVCQTTIEEDEAQTRCDACGLPFHVECWEENLGCSAYGCSNVNALKAGPDLSITSLPTLPSYRRQQAAVQQRQAAATEADVPWEFLLLAASALALLFGLLCFGLFSLVAGAGAIAFMVHRREAANLAVMIACIVISGVGFLGGLIVSLLFHL